MRVVGVAGLTFGWADLVICEHVAAHQPDQAGQDDGGKAGGVIEFGEIPDESPPTSPEPASSPPTAAAAADREGCRIAR